MMDATHPEIDDQVVENTATIDKHYRYMREALNLVCDQ